MYLNCDQGVGLEKTVAVADGEIEERLHYVSWFARRLLMHALCMVHACIVRCMITIYSQ